MPGTSIFEHCRLISMQGIIIWAALDPANPFIAPASAPFVIGLAYAAMIWGFADITISTNLARDLGTRIVAAIFYGGGVSVDKRGGNHVVNILIVAGFLLQVVLLDLDSHKCACNNVST